MELKIVNYSPFYTNEAKAYRSLSRAFKSKKNATGNHDTKSAVYFIFLMKMKDYVN